MFLWLASFLYSFCRGIQSKAFLKSTKHEKSKFRCLDFTYLSISIFNVKMLSTVPCIFLKPPCSQNKWFDQECETEKGNLQSLRKKISKDPYNSELRQLLRDEKKRFKQTLPVYLPPPGGGGVLKFNAGRLRPEVQPLTLLYTIFAEKVPLLYTFY